MATYGFQSIVAAYVGPTGAINLANNAGPSPEGLTINPEGDKNIMTLGADGTPMHSLRSAKGGSIIARFLKTSVTNALLSAAYNAETADVSLHGIGTFSIRDKYRGDVITAQLCAFRRHAPTGYAEQGNVLEWEWQIGILDWTLGFGAPVRLNA